MKRHATARHSFDPNLPRRPQLAERAAAIAREARAAMVRRAASEQDDGRGGDDHDKENDPRWRQRRLKLLPKWRIGVNFLAECRVGVASLRDWLAPVGGGEGRCIHAHAAVSFGAAALGTQRRAVSKSAPARCGTELSERALVADTTWHTTYSVACCGGRLSLDDCASDMMCAAHAG
jgi:hypothetical protein